MDTTPLPVKRSPGYSLAAGIVILAILVLIPIALTGSSGWSPAGPGTSTPVTAVIAAPSPFTPIFTDPADKLRETAHASFTQQLFREAVAYEPLLNTSGTQVHMGYWSGRGNHGSLVTLLDAINDAPLQRAIWDEGATTSNQYPSYVTMLSEHWYERASSRNGTVTIFGMGYTDPYPVTFVQADDIWGQYSQRYADMAVPISRATGKPVQVWCFVEGARGNRVFYTYELPELRQLEQDGVVNVHFAKTKTANWTSPGDWIEGTKNAPVPVT
jgi:hypothetical protein